MIYKNPTLVMVPLATVGEIRMWPARKLLGRSHMTSVVDKKTSHKLGSRVEGSVSWNLTFR